MINKWIKYLVRLYMPVYQIESDTMKILFAGYSSKMKSYFIRFLQVSGNKTTFSGRKWFWEIPKIIKSGSYDMVIAETSPITFNFFRKCNGYLIPASARMKINIDRPMNEIIKRSASDFPDVIRKIRKYGLTYGILTDIESLNYFNNKFYLPYITKRHGEEVWIEDLNNLWKSSDSPFLIAIKEAEKIVGMLLLNKTQNSFSLLHIGLLEGNEEYLRHGVIGAMYYFSIIEAKKADCKSLDLGGVRPFLTDGLTKYKMGLGAEFLTDCYNRRELYLWIGVNEHSVSAIEFIHSNPFMYINKDLRLVPTKYDNF